jgi:hypothetical protein
VNIELILKLLAVVVALVAVLPGFLHFIAAKSSVGYQNLKTEMELLSQNIAACEAEPVYREFLIEVRKERISFLVFGIAIPNADVERAIAYYVKAGGKVMTREIARAWQYRDTKAEQLSFQLSRSLKVQYILVLGFAMFCLLLTLGCAIALVFKFPANEALVFACVSLVGCISTHWLNQGLLMGAQLAKLERKRIRVESESPHSIDENVDS